MKLVITLIKDWWRIPDQYDTFIRYLNARGLMPACRLVIGATAMWMGFILICARFSELGPQGTFWRTVNLIVVALCIISAFAWWLIPPTRLGSVIFVIGSDLAVAASAAGDSSPLARLLACVVFAAIGGYISFCHNPKLQLGHLIFAGVVTVFAGWELLVGPNADPGLGIAKISLVLSTVVVIPVVSQVMIAVLSYDANTSDLDPLTGLLNRRGLAKRVDDLVGNPITESDALLVAVIDLDRFKLINDIHGHDVGDNTIVRTAFRIRLWTTQSALIARVGGDEFVVMERAPVSVVSKLEAQIAAAMNGVNDDPPTSASVGLAVRASPRIHTESVEEVFSELFRVADSAMYEAKREGGNQVRAIVA